MQMYLADCIFPDIEGQLAAYKSFCELWDSGEMVKADNFPGFEMLFRVHAPVSYTHLTLPTILLV